MVMLALRYIQFRRMVASILLLIAFRIIETNGRMLRALHIPLEDDNV